MNRVTTTSSSSGCSGGTARCRTVKNLPELATSNRHSMVLQCVFYSKPVTRTDLARYTTHTPVTNSNVVVEHLSAGLAEELWRRPVGRAGRCRTLVGLREMRFGDPQGLLDGPLLEVATATIRPRTMPAIDDEDPLRMSSVGKDIALAAAAAPTSLGQIGLT